MTSSKKRDKQIVEEEGSALNADLMSQFAEVISQSILERDVNHNDSFELYAHQLRIHLHHNLDLFKMRFSEGYRLLLEEIGKENLT